MGDPAPPAMSSQRPYLLRALYEWIADNGMTPHVLVDARMPGVRVPVHAVKDGRIVLNPGSVGLPAYDDDHIAFHVHQTGSPHARYALCERVDTGAGAG